MSQSLNGIKAKISSTENMSKITKAMQMISAAKLTKSESKLRTHESYAQSLEDIIKKTVEVTAIDEHIFFVPNTKVKCTAYLVVTSDRGLAGGYNNKVIKLAEQIVNERAQNEYKFYMVGKKAFDYARRANLTVENDYLFIPDSMIYADIAPVVNQVVADYATGIIDEVVILYHNFLSKLTQEPATQRVLPLEKELVDPKLDSLYLFEPNKSVMVQTLLLKYLNGKIYEIVLRAKLAEHASRMNAMQNATDNAVEIIKESQLIYNRARQAAITQEINEIVGGATALKKKKR